MNEVKWFWVAFICLAQGEVVHAFHDGVFYYPIFPVVFITAIIVMCICKRRGDCCTPVTPEYKVIRSKSDASPPQYPPTTGYPQSTTTYPQKSSDSNTSYPLGTTTAPTYPQGSGIYSPGTPTAPTYPYNPGTTVSPYPTGGSTHSYPNMYPPPDGKAPPYQPPPAGYYPPLVVTDPSAANLPPLPAYSTH